MFKVLKDILVLVQDGVHKVLKVTKVFNQQVLQDIEVLKVTKVVHKVLKDILVLILEKAHKVIKVTKVSNQQDLLVMEDILE